jgi:hypothetical protein
VDNKYDDGDRKPPGVLLVLEVLVNGGDTSNSVAALRSSSPLRTPAQPLRGTVCTSWPFRNRAS